jgi:guanylate kinase
VVGGLRLKKKFPERTLAIFVKPPSINELQIRLKKRKTESPEKIAMRVAKASTEMATAPQFDVIIKNDNLAEAKQKAVFLVKDFIQKPIPRDEEE